MGLIKWVNKRIKRLDIWDIGCIKWSSVFFGIIIGAHISDFAKQYLWPFIVLVILLAIRPLYKTLKK